MKTDYEIRSAQAGDLEGVYAVFSLTDSMHRDAHPEIFKKSNHPEDIKDYLSDSIRAEAAAVFVAVRHSEIIGAVIAWTRQTHDIPVLVQGSYLSVDNLAVIEAYRMQGVGEALMDRIHLWAGERGINQVQLTVWDFNREAQAFYNKLGYEILHHRMRKDLP